MSAGTPWYPIVHIEEISRAFLASLQAPRSAIRNEAFNVGSGTGDDQVHDLAEIVEAGVLNSRSS